VRHKLTYRFVLIILFTQQLYSLSLNESTVDAITQIKSLLSAQFGGSFRIECISDMDSLKTNDWVPSGIIKNPYGTLNHCFSFVARYCQLDSKNYEMIIPAKNNYEDSITVFGIYSDGKIVSVLSFDRACVYESGKIYEISDINQDGKVEILIEWTEKEDINSNLIWIFSWDGINTASIYQKRESGVSNLENVEDIVDLDGDGIMELIGMKGTDPNNMIQVTYSWNGSLYGQWQNGPQIGQMKNTRADNCQVTVSSSSIKEDTLFAYNYTIANNISSKQSLKYFLVADNAVNTSANPPSDWKSGRLKRNKLSSFIGLSDSNWIKPGRILSGFQLKSTGLPGIMNYYIQAPYNIIKPDDTVPSDLELWFLSNVYNNSFKGTTISPVDVSNSFIPLNYLDTLTNYATQSRSLGWIKDQATTNKYLGYFSSARTNLIQHDSAGTRTVLSQVLRDVDVDSTALLTSEAYALLRFNTEYLISKLPSRAPGFYIQFVNSKGQPITDGSLQYYDGLWKDAVSNNDGTFTVNTNLTSLGLRMTYAYGSQTKSNVTASTNYVIFQTVSTQVQLQNSLGTFIDTGSVQYYAGAWRSFGVTSNGVASKELLPGSYSFRMNYAGASKDKQQDLSTNSTVVFQTVNASVQLQNSQGALIDQGIVQYYSGAWRNFGTTTNGTANKELLPNNYSFRMNYAYASKDKQQDISSNATVVFQTVNATVQLKNSQGNLVDQGTVQYYSGAWRNLGTTTNGIATKELLPNSCSFRMTNEFISLDKTQDISTNSTVNYATVLCTIRAKDAQNNPISNAQASYYSGAWRIIGLTANGQITKEVLPVNLTFRISYNSKTQDKAQNISTNSIVDFVVP
jgi:hypothetical protein